MRFDPAKALETFRELGDPRFAGPDGEPHVADFVAERFEKMGLPVERREVIGSRWPHRIAPWVRWLGYGFLIASAYLLLRLDTLWSVLLACIVLYFAAIWLDAVLANRLRLGGRMPPMETAPLIVARIPGESSPPVRVVFQALLGGLRADFFQALPVNPYWMMMGVHYLALTLSVLIAVASIYRSGHDFRLLMIATVFFGFLWVASLCLLSWEYRQSRSVSRSHPPERNGLSVLLEMARSWPRTRSREIEAIFVAAGGQRLDYGGPREVLRLLRKEWPSKPSLLVLFFAPGVGETLHLGECRVGDGELVEDAAKSLWIPYESRHHWTMLQSWPFEREWTEAVALMGSDLNPRADSDASADPQTLHRAAQLATEIALRWAKEQQPPPDSQT